MSDDALDIRTELLLGGAWVVATTDVRTSADMKISHGRSDWAGQVDPCRLTFVLNNRDGRYSVRNPMSPYVDLLNRNLPVRVSVPQESSYLHMTADVAATSTPDAAPLDIVGDIDVRFEGKINWYTSATQILMQKWSGTAQRSWVLAISNGSLLFQWSANGAAVTGLYRWAIPAMPRTACVRAVLDVNNGAGGHTIRMYWAETMSGPWTQFSEDPSMTGVGTTSVFSSTGDLLIGGLGGTPAVRGQVHRIEVRNGIAGTVVTNPDFTVQAPGATSFVDGSGRTWTVLTASEISNRNYRFHGEISSLPSDWDPSGNDSWVTVTAQGQKRRYQQGKAALQSALRRSVVREQDMLAYWPMEEGENATQAFSPVPGVSPMAVSHVKWAANDTLPASRPLPALASENSGANLPTLRGKVPAPTAPITGWQARMLYRMDTENTTLYSFLYVLSTGTANRWVIQSRNNQSRIVAQDADGTILDEQFVTTGTNLYHRWVSLALYITQSGSNVSWAVSWQDVGGDFNAYTGSFAGVIGRPTAVVSPPAGFSSNLDGLAFGHIGVFGDRLIDPVYNNAWTAYTGETAGTRMLRLATEESRPLEVDAPVGRTVAFGPYRGERVGPQLSASWLSLIEDAAAADGGLLYEDTDALALRYRDRETMYGQAPRLTLDYTQPGHIMPGIRPVDDDQATRNNVTVTRANGSSANSVQLTGPLNVQDPGTSADAVGEYDDSLTLSLHADDQTQRIADWRRALGTYNGSRFPTLTFNLRRAPELAEDFLQLIPGDRADILNLPVGKGGPDPAQLLVQGWTETLAPYRWEAQLMCTPAPPWSVAQWDTDTDALGTASRWDSDGTTLVSALTSSATTALVRTDGALWTMNPADLPFDITIGGERMRVTAVAPAALDAFGRTTASSWGTADSGQAWTSTGGTAANFSVASGQGRHTNSTANVARYSVINSGSPDCDLTVSVAANALSTGASQFAGVVARHTDASNHYYARVEFATSGAVTLSIRKRVAGTDTQLTFLVMPFTHVAGRLYGVRLQIVGNTLRAKCWDTVASRERYTWTLVTKDSDLTSGTEIGARSITASTNTNVNAVIAYDSLTDRAPQRFALQRSLNTIVKSHAAGAAIDLADPDVWGL